MSTKGLYAALIVLLLGMIVFSGAIKNPVYADPPDWELNDWLLLSGHSQEGAIVRADGSGFTSLRETLYTQSDIPISERYPVIWQWTVEGNLILNWPDDYPPEVKESMATVEQLTATDGTEFVVQNNQAQFVEMPPGQYDLWFGSEAGIVSPDGRWVVTTSRDNCVYVENEPGKVDYCDLQILLRDNFGGGTEAVLTTHTHVSGYDYVNSMSWSSDSQFFVYELTDTELHDIYRNGRIYRINIREGVLPGYDPVLLTLKEQKSLAPAWSPKGDYIAYICSLPEVADSLCVMYPDGVQTDGTGQYLVVPDISHIELVEWSPDGSKLSWIDGDGGIYWIATECLPESCNLADVHAISYAESRIWEQSGVYTGYCDPLLAWHSDNRHVAYDCHRQDTGCQVCVLDTETGSIRQVTDQDCGEWEGKSTRNYCSVQQIIWRP